MKNIIIIALLFIGGSLFGQSAFTILSSHADNPVAYSASSLNNPWVGAKLAYNVSGDASESFLLSGRVLYVAASGNKWAFPIVGNVGLNNADSISVDNGVSIGAFPYYMLTDGGQLQLVLHGGLNYHIRERSDASLNEFRMLVGLEAALYPRERQGSPTTLSIAPEYILTTGNNPSNSWGLSITGVVPVANGLGLLIESVIPFDNSSRTTGLKIGVIVNGSVK